MPTRNFQNIGEKRLTDRIRSVIILSVIGKYKSLSKTTRSRGVVV